MSTINAIILTDDSAGDNSLKDFFLQLSRDSEILLSRYCAQNNIQLAISSLCSDDFDKNTLSTQLAEVNERRFLNLWFAHGNVEELHNAGEKVVSLSENYYLFTNALVYTFSCSNGDELADALIMNGTLSFLGYARTAYVPYNLDDEVASVALLGLTAFLKGESLYNAVEEMRDGYTSLAKSDEIEPMARILLEVNAQGLVLKGRKDLTINDMII